MLKLQTQCTQLYRQTHLILSNQGFGSQFGLMMRTEELRGPKNFGVRSKEYFPEYYDFRLLLPILCDLWEPCLWEHRKFLGIFRNLADASNFKEYHNCFLMMPTAAAATGSGEPSKSHFVNLPKFLDTFRHGIATIVCSATICQEHLLRAACSEAVEGLGVSFWSLCQHTGKKSNSGHII